MNAMTASEKARLLLADDHVLVAQGLERLLLECFCHIDIVRSGEALVESVRHAPPDVVVADISMEGMSGLEAMRTLAGGRDDAGPADVLLLDIHLPGRSGLDVMHTLKDEGNPIKVLVVSMYPEDQYAMRALRGLGHDVPFVFLTMHADPELAAEAIQSGASGYVLKASAGEELVRALLEVLAGRTYVTPTLAARTIRAGAGRAGGGLTQKQREILVRVAQGLRSKQIAFELGLSVRTVESHKYTIMQELGVHSTVELVRKAAQAGLIAIDAPH